MEASFSGGMPGPLSLTATRNHPVRDSRAHFDPALAFHGLDGVDQQIQQRLGQPDWIGHDGRQRFDQRGW